MSGNKAGKTCAESALITQRLMMPADANSSGNVFGGSIMKYVDEVASIVALRHARKNVVTASMDSMSFIAPVFIGNLLILKSSVNCVGKTSMEIGVRIEAENVLTGDVTHTSSCYLTYVALEQGRPSPVPPLIPETEDEKRRYKEAMARRGMRDSLRDKIG